MKGGDVDMCLTIGEAAGNREAVVEELAALLRKRKFILLIIIIFFLLPSLITTLNFLSQER